MNMGTKRKASFDDSLAPTTSPKRPLLTSSESSTSNITVNASDPTLNLWNIAGAPYFNSRTRKRFRDNRPDTETVHQHTLNKLYNAQRQPSTSTPEAFNHDRHMQQENLQPDSMQRARFGHNVEFIQGPSNVVEIPRDRNQRSLDSFFGSGNSASPNSSYANVSPLPATIFQPQDHVPHLVPPHPRNVPSILTCEDCGAPLLTKHSSEAIDAEMLDADGYLVDPEVDEAWACAVCVKRVCDVCAVRGDHRVCLECAVPGGGRYNAEELREKRWVGGIGWM